MKTRIIPTHTNTRRLLFNPRKLNIPNELARLRTFFFDLGANKGDSIMAFSGIQENTGLSTSSWFGTLPDRGPSSEWEVFAFEANPVFNTLLEQTREILKKERPNWKAHIFNESAIGTEDQVVTFHLDTINAEHSFWGSSLRESPDVIKSRKSGNGKDVQVQMYSLSRLLKENCQEGDLVIVKMDVEGTEYDLIKDALATGCNALVDIWLVEWHPGPEDVHINALGWILGEKLRKWF
eukprot:TRINITY_DN2483_c0_g3_i2.p1 TRINITY_DN2483_c0_g3~~TRINITY_DN2483_c0_g3_i2.p1  ORF type:complete len:237 (-),score=32.13 TRINITY_DN2483_c0_g3_i2:237-947(-)